MIACTGLFLAAHLAVGQYVNDEWDTDFTFECESGKLCVWHFFPYNSFEMFAPIQASISTTQQANLTALLGVENGDLTVVMGL